MNPLEVTAELVHTGTELLTGARSNEHARWLGQRLTELGYVVIRHTAVPDQPQAIVDAVRGALSRADLVIVTGGLGPTSDDRTRQEIARLTGRTLREDPAIRRRLQEFYAARGRTLPGRALVQALVPEGASVFENRWGTAPGLVLKVEPRPQDRLPGERPPGEAAPRSSWLILLPGPSRELRPMFEECVVPWLREELPVLQEWESVILRTADVPESELEQRVREALGELASAGVELAFRARSGQVDVCLMARGPGARQRMVAAELAVREKLGTAVYARGQESLESVVVRLLRQRQETLAVAESCTGGYLAHRVTNVPGASAVFTAGWVTYSNWAKVEFLGVDPDTLARYGAVSEPVALQMAQGARQKARATHALGITGIAGPTGGTPDKPVGTVYLAYAGPTGVTVLQRFNPLDREPFKELTTTQALELLRRALAGREKPPAQGL